MPEGDDEITAAGVTDFEWEEYRLLQDKIDRIADFRFKIKGWTATLVVGFLLAVAARPLPWLGHLAFAAVLAVFGLQELRQASWEIAYGARCRDLETRIRLRRSKAQRSLDAKRGVHAAPGVAHMLGRHRKVLRRTSLGRAWDWSSTWANRCFYAAILLLVVGSKLIPSEPSAPKDVRLQGALEVRKPGQSNLGGGSSTILRSDDGSRTEDAQVRVDEDGGAPSQVNERDPAR